MFFLENTHKLWLIPFVVGLLLIAVILWVVFRKSLFRYLYRISFYLQHSHQHCFDLVCFKEKCHAGLFADAKHLVIRRGNRTAIKTKEIIWRWFNSKQSITPEESLWKNCRAKDLCMLVCDGFVLTKGHLYAPHVSYMIQHPSLCRLCQLEAKPSIARPTVRTSSLYVTTQGSNHAAGNQDSMKFYEELICV